MGISRDDVLRGLIRVVHAEPHPTLRELRAPLLWSLAAIVASSIPYLWGYLSAPPGLRFGGMILAVDDMNSYLAKMLQGARGEWLFHFPFTTEDHPGTLLYMFFILLGKLAALLHVPMVAGYHLARVVLALVFLLTAYRFCCFFLPRKFERRLAFLLVCCGGGLGWIPLLVGPASGISPIAPDLVLAEFVPFLTLTAYPHLALAQALTLGSFLLWLGQDKRPHRSVLAGLLLLLAGLVQPFQLPLGYMAIGAYVVVRAVQTKALPRQEAASGAMIVAVTMPLAGYYAFAASLPAYRVWLGAVRYIDLPPLARALAYGLPGLLAVVGAWRALRSDRPAGFLVAWAGASVLFSSLPVAGAVRLMAGSFVPVAILGSLGMTSILRGLPGGRSLPLQGEAGAAPLARVALGAVPAVAAISNVVALVAALALVGGHRAPLYYPQGVYDALDVLRESASPRHAVMSWFSLGNLVPAYAGNRVVMGHGSETLHFDEKVRAVRAFFATDTPESEREEILRQQDVSYVLVGDEERGLGRADLATLPFLKPVLRNDEVALYAVRR